MKPTDINFRQLIFAREYRGFSQTDLATKIPGLSQSNLSKFEKGISTLSDDLIVRIIEFLDFPASFFNLKICNRVENPHYRKRVTINKKDVINIESSIRLIGYIIDQMTESLEWPEFKLSPLNIEDGYSPITIASYTRKILGLGSTDPVKDICQILEKNGIIVVELDQIAKFDGASIKTDQGYPVIVVNRGLSNDRKRFTIAHELGHLIMHVLGDFPIADYRDEKEREKEADQFASEFLMPESEIKNSLYNLKISSLAELKKYWLTSMASIIRRAYTLNCIDYDRYTYLNIEMSRLGYKKKEPLNVYIDKPTLFLKGYQMHKTELNYNDQELSEAFCLPNDVITRFCHIPLNSGRLRVVA